MPLYEFHCSGCGKDSELLVRSRDWKSEHCPECGSAKLEKKLSTFAAGGPVEDAAPACSGVPTSCGRCGTA